MPSEAMARLVDELCVATFNEAGTPGTGPAEDKARTALFLAIATLEARAIAAEAEAARMRGAIESILYDVASNHTDVLMVAVASRLRTALTGGEGGGG